MTYMPPYTITTEILSYVASIQRFLGRLSGSKGDMPPLYLRKENSIKTIQSSLAIEGNTLTYDQIQTLLEGKLVIAPQKDIQEVTNALYVYRQLNAFNPLKIKDFLQVHHLLMKDLVGSPGQWRQGGVGIFKGKALTHLPPPASRVPILMADLFTYLKKDHQIPWLIKACIFHYELEFIHPFEDGNGRMGRLWQQLLLMKEHPLFAYISVEEMIRQYQQQYYETLSLCDKRRDSTLFIAFSLKQILEALKVYESRCVFTVNTSEARLTYAKNHFQERSFLRKDYLKLHSQISTATASRDLLKGVVHKILIKTGEDNQTQYQFYR